MRRLPPIWMLTGTLCLSAVSAPAMPSNYDGRSWAAGPITLVVDTSGVEARQPGQGLFLQSAIMRAANEWNAALGVPLFTIAVATTPTDLATRSLGDGISGIYFTTRISSTQAFAAQFGYSDSWRTASHRFLETDLIFNPIHLWEVYDGPLRYDDAGARIAEMHRVALHEMGHLLGLMHPASDAELTIMRSKMSDAESLSKIDLADATRVADVLFDRNRPRVRSFHWSRSARSASTLHLRGSSNGFFTRKMWVEVRSDTENRVVRLSVATTWKRTIKLLPGRYRLELYYRVAGRHQRYLAFKKSLAVD